MSRRRCRRPAGRPPDDETAEAPDLELSLRRAHEPPDLCPVPARPAEACACCPADSTKDRFLDPVARLNAALEGSKMNRYATAHPSASTRGPPRRPFRRDPTRLRTGQRSETGRDAGARPSLGEVDGHVVEPHVAVHVLHQAVAHHAGPLRRCHRRSTLRGCLHGDAPGPSGPASPRGRPHRPRK